MHKRDLFCTIQPDEAAHGGHFSGKIGTTLDEMENTQRKAQNCFIEAMEV
jgi:hypothetical protein